MQLECLTFDEKYNILKIFIDNKEDIYVFGDGNNGKTFVITKILEKTNNNNYITFEVSLNDTLEYTKKQIEDFKSRGKYLIIQANQDLDLPDITKIKFCGKYNKETNMYEFN